MSECDRSQSPGPGWFTASSSCYHQYWFISNLWLCILPESPLAQGYNLLSIASTRINIFRPLGSHVYLNRDKGITFVIGLYSFRRKTDNKTNLHSVRFKCILNLWLIVALSLPPSLENSDKMSHFRLPFNVIHDYRGVFEVLFPIYPHYVCPKSFRGTCIYLRNKHFLLKTVFPMLSCE